MGSHTETTADDRPYTVVNSRKKRRRKKDDRDRLLDASRWPAYISVSDWYFKLSMQQTKNKTGTSVGLSDGRVTVSMSHEVSTVKGVIIADNHNNCINAMDMDETIITQIDNTDTNLNHTQSLNLLL
jgi:hypothetical protein